MEYKSRLNVQRMLIKHKELVELFNSGNHYLDKFLKSDIV